MEYINEQLRDKIYSIKTYETYAKHNNYFIAYVEDKYPQKERATIDQCKKYVPEYLQSRIDKGLSAYTIQMEAAALGKLFQCNVNEFGVKLPERTRNDITRSREATARDYGFSLDKNKEIIDFCRGTGLRRHELANLEKSQLHGDILKVQGKGGKVREVPIVGPNKQAIIDRINNTKDGAKVWDKVPSHMDVHSYRSDYATALYKAYERDSIPKEDRYYCRGDRKGTTFDKKAMLIVSQALGHNRLEVMAGHYIR